MIISEKKEKISSARDVALMMWPILEAEQPIDREREHFWAIGLDRGNITKFVELTNLGNAWSVDPTPPNVFRLAVMHACSSVIVCHNHPSGKIMPSPEDDKFTDLLIEAGKIIGINVLDHVIIGDYAEYYSYVDNGKLKEVTASPSPLPDKFITANKQSEDIQKIIDECNKIHKRNQKKLEKHQKSIDELKKEINDLKSRINAASMRIDVASACIESQLGV